MRGSTTRSPASVRPRSRAGPRGTVVGWFPVTQFMRGPVARALGTGPDPGAATIAGAPVGEVATRDATLTLGSTRSGATHECRLGDEDWRACGPTWTLSGLADGTHRVAVRSVSPEGWVELGTGAQASWRVEAAPPETRLLSVADPLSSSARFTFEADEVATFECRWDGGPWAGCGVEGSASRSLTDGPHVFEVRATDESGRREAMPARHVWTIDTRSPATTIVDGPHGVSGATSGVYQFASDDPTATFECLGASLRWVPCRSGEPAETRDGVIDVRARDASGGVDASPAYWRWEFRAEPPPAEVRVLTYPTYGEVVLRLWAERWNTLECRADDRPRQRCDETTRLLDLPPGHRRIQARAIDDSGRLGPVAETVADIAALNLGEPVAAPKRSAATAVEVRIDGGPPSATNATGGDVVFSADGAATECGLDYEAWAPCVSPLRVSGLTEGCHRVQVRPVGGGTGAEHRWRVDLTPPDTRIDGRPLVDGSRTTKPVVALRFETSDPGSGEPEGFAPGPAWCRIDGAPFVNCSGSRTFSGLVDGVHVVEAYAVDRAGNADPTPARFTFVVGAVVPDTAIESGPGTSATRDATFVLRATGPADGFECRVDEGAWEPCEAQARVTGVADGLRRFQVRAVVGGRVDLTPAVWEWTVEAPPAVRILSGPPRLTAAAAATFSVTSDDPAARLECRVDGGPWTSACSTAGPLAEGAHRFEARAVDTTGLVTTAEPWTWTTDTVAPATFVDDAPAPKHRWTSQRMKLRADEPARFECRLNSTTWTTCGPVWHPTFQLGDYVAEIRAVDRAGTPDPTPVRIAFNVRYGSPSLTLRPSTPGTGPASVAIDTLEPVDLACRFDHAAPWTPCGPTWSHPNLSRGRHYLAPSSCGSPRRPPAGSRCACSTGAGGSSRAARRPTPARPPARSPSSRSGATVSVRWTPTTGPVQAAKRRL